MTGGRVEGGGGAGGLCSIGRASEGVPTAGENFGFGLAGTFGVGGLGDEASEAGRNSRSLSGLGAGEMERAVC